jgi:transposase
MKTSEGIIMNRKRYTQEFKQQVVKKAKHQEFKQTRADGKKAAPYATTIEEFRKIEEENDKLKRIVGEKDLEINILRDLVKKLNPACPKR